MSIAFSDSGPKSRASTRDSNDRATGEINSGHLLAFIERIERLHEERKALAQDISEIYGEAKGNGFDVKVLREIVKIRGQDPEKRAEHDTVLELYLAALGMTGL